VAPVTEGVVGDTIVVGDDPTGNDPAIPCPTPVATAWPTLVGAVLAGAGAPEVDAGALLEPPFEEA
jgi:hypothetical protein